MSLVVVAAVDVVSVAALNTAIGCVTVSFMIAAMGSAAGARSAVIVMSVDVVDVAAVSVVVVDVSVTAVSVLAFRDLSTSETMIAAPIKTARRTPSALAGKRDGAKVNGIKGAGAGALFFGGVTAGGVSALTPAFRRWGAPRDGGP